MVTGIETVMMRFCRGGESLNSTSKLFFSFSFFLKCLLYALVNTYLSLKKDSLSLKKPIGRDA
jgi:uncharacterized membrane protein